MRAAEIMTVAVPACRPYDTLVTAAQAMWNRDSGVAVVVDESERVLGVLTERDLWMVAAMKGGRLGDLPISTAMSWDVRTCSPDASIFQIDALMEWTRSRWLLVVDSLGCLLGLVSRTDLALALSREQSRRDPIACEPGRSRPSAPINAPRAPRRRP